jgi:hypothetical protein
VDFNDGTFLENLSDEESTQVVKERPEEWSSVRCMDYAKDLDPENAKRRKAWKM